MVAGHPPAFSSHRFPYALGAVETTPPPPTLPFPCCIVGLSICLTSVQGAHVPAHYWAPKCGDPPGKDHAGWEGAGLSPA